MTASTCSRPVCAAACPERLQCRPTAPMPCLAGGWDPTKPLVLSWTEGHIWTATAPLPAASFEFKVRGRHLVML